MELIKLDKEDLGIDKAISYHLYDIWGKRIIEDVESFYFEISADDVVFIHYGSK